MVTLLGPTLAAADPRTWLAAHLAARYADASSARADEVWWSLSDLLTDDAARLRAIHTALTDRATPGQAAAHYLADWFAGAVAGAVGFGLAAGSAGFVVDPHNVRWLVHPEGWPEAIELGTVKEVLVLDGHPWSGLPGVTRTTDAAELLDRTVAALVTAVEPIVEACRGFARVGRPGLWNEVVDGLAGALVHQELVTVTPAMVEVLDATSRTPAAPWKARPSLRFTPTPRGPLFVLQKGGCCLAYTRTDWPEDDEDELDDAALAYRAMFPRAPEEPWYCSTCSFREPADCDARVAAWHELTHPDP